MNLSVRLRLPRRVRRFLQHVLPSGFVKVRYYGLFASANRGALSMVRMLFECNDTVKKKKTNNAGYFKCPVCKKEMIIYRDEININPEIHH